MKKGEDKKKNESNKASVVFRNGGWSGWSLPSLPFDMYVKTLMFTVEDGSISRSEKN